MIEKDVVDYLTNDTTLDTLLGASGSDSKFYPVQLPLKKVSEPYIIFTTNAMGGLLENFLEVSMSFNCMDTNYLTAKAIRDRLLFLLDRQDTIQSLITSTKYYIYWCKHVGGSLFKETGLDFYNFASIFDFKYAVLARGAISVINKTLSIPVFGNFVDEFIFLVNYHWDSDVTIKKIGIHSDNAPTGTSATLDILKNDVEQSRIATLAAGARGQTTDITDIGFGASDKFELKWKSVGSVNPGEGGIIMIHYQ